MRKTTERGFTVVELLTSFTLASVVMILLFNILIAVKADYVEDKIETEYNAQQSLLSHALNKDATNCSLSAMTKTGNTFLLSFMKSDTCSGGSKTLKVEETKITYNGKVYEFPDGVTIDVSGSSAKEGDISGIQYFFLKIPITMNIYSTGETRKLDITSFYTKKYVAPPKPRNTYKVIYTDGVDSVVYFPDQVTELKAGENTPDFKGNPTRAGYIFRGWSPTVNPVVSSGDADSDGNIIYTATWQRVDEQHQTEDWIVIDFDTNTWSINSSGQGNLTPKSGSLSASNPVVTYGYKKRATWGNYYYDTYPKADPIISYEYGSGISNVARVTTAVHTQGTTTDDFGGVYRGARTTFEGLKAGHVDIVVRSVYDITKVTSASGSSITGVTTIPAQYTHLFHVEVRQSNATYTVSYTDGVSGQVIFPDESYDGLKAGETTPPFSGGTPTRFGYTFMGWSPTINKYVSGDHANKNGEIIYTATWKKLKISNFNKELVKSPNNVPNGLNVTGITYPNTEGKVTLPGNGSPITLLFKITVTGEIGAKYSVTDTGATYVGGDPMEGTLKTQIATIYVTRSYNKNDVNENGNLINTAMIIPGKNEESSSTSTETVPALIEKDQTTYTVSWYDDNKKTVLATLTYKEGEKEPAYNGKVPTKPDDKNYSYKFSGWIKQENPLNNDTVSYVAQYGAIVKDVTYKVEWYDEKGNVLSSEIRTGVLGSIVSVTDSDKVIDGSGEVDENGNVVLKLYFKTNKDNAINTGDNSHTILYIVLCVVSLGIIAGLVFILKKKNMKKN